MDLRKLKDEAREFGIIYSSKVMEEILVQLRQVACSTDPVVLLTGPTGVGKNLIAKMFHSWGLRKNSPLIQQDCGLLSQELARSELFGHVKGAFTGAIKDRWGILRKASKATLFLDEVGNTNIEVQQMFLRLLDDGVFQRMGEGIDYPADVRIIAATNKNLEAAVSQGVFMGDLFSRLREFHFEIPPLDQRPEDIPDLIDFFIAQIGAAENREVTITPEARSYLSERVSYPENVRELGRAIKRAIVLTERTDKGTELTTKSFASNTDLVPRQQPSRSETHSPAEIHYCTETIDRIFNKDIEEKIRKKYKIKGKYTKKPDMKALKHTLNELINKNVSLTSLRKAENYEAPEFLSYSALNHFILKCWRIFNKKCWDSAYKGEDRPAALVFLDLCRTAIQQHQISEDAIEANEGNNSV